MLRIAVVSRYFPSSGEPWQGRSAYQTIRALSLQAEVHVFYPNSAYPSFLRPRTRLYNGLDKNYSPAGVSVSYHDYPAIPLLSRPFNGAMAASALLPHVRAFQPDLIFSIFLYPDSYAALQIAKKLHVPLVAMGIGSDIHSIADRISAKYTRTVLREADFLVTVSEDLREKALAMGASPERSRAIVNGCDLSVFHVRDRAEARRQLELDAESRIVLYIGRMDVRKGLRELVEASAKLRMDRPDLQVYMVGEGPDRPQITQAIEGAGAANYIHALPPCRPDDVALWMAAADLVTLPSYMEGCPNVVLEALACGRPVVATRVGGIPEIMSDACGRLIPPRDTSALAEALDAVVATSWDANSISAHWSRSWSTVAGELMDVFESVSGASRGARA
ncbi:MAG TPA: glycosyltransferase [Acidobacteriaceae bacterium]|nr:glycosyltransferase [Acidobacteriaceae bacterium]